MRRYWLFWIAMLAGGLVFTVGLMEGALRVYTAVNQPFGQALKAFDPLAAQIEPHGVLGYRQRPNSVLHYKDGVVATSNSLGYRGPEVPPQPEPGTVRIILLGGSTTHGYGVADTGTIDAYMRTILHERFPTRRFEVVNLALDGYDSYQMLQRLQSDGLPMHPTVVVLNEGINDVRSAWVPNLKDGDPRSMIWLADLARLRADKERGRPTLWSLTKHYLLVARLPGYLRQQLSLRVEAQQRAKIESAATAAKSASAKADSSGAHPPYPEAVDIFDHHFREMVDLSLAQGSMVVLSTPPSDLPTYPPTATSAQSYWVIDAKTTQEYRDRLAARLQTIEHDERAKGHPVTYVKPVVAKPMFLDDCHLKPDGNRVVATAFVDAIIPMLGNVAATGAPVQRRPGQ